jgi:hypothetical protein
VYYLIALADRPFAYASPELTLDEAEAALQEGELEGLRNIASRTHKRCRKCDTTKPLDDFYHHNKALDGHQSICKPCSKETCAVYLEENRAAQNERSRRNQQRLRDEDPTYTVRAKLRNTFGMTLEQYEAKLAAQGGVCAVCGTEPGKMRLAVDHDRGCCPGEKSCGKCIRDLLCGGCNNGSGLADDSFLLRRKADYLDLWQFRHAEVATQAQAA